MPRSIWSGSVSFGLVSIPVKLFNGVSRKTVSFNQIDSRTGSRIKQKRVSAADGSEVDREHIVKGYEISKDNYVTIDSDELATVMPKAQRTIDLEEFVGLAEIDPMFFDSAYYLVPDEVAVKPYALLLAAMEESDRVGIARFVMRSKQYLAAIRATDGALVLSTMVYADEVNAVDEFEELEAVSEVELTERERTMASALIESLAAEFEPEKYRDTYRDAVLELIERKAAGETDIVLQPAMQDEGQVVDLMAALEASVAEAKEARKRHPTAKDAPVEAEEDVEEEAVEAPVLTEVNSGKKPKARKATKASKAKAKKAPAKKATKKKTPARKSA